MPPHPLDHRPLLLGRRRSGGAGASRGRWRAPRSHAPRVAACTLAGAPPIGRQNSRDAGRRRRLESGAAAESAACEVGFAGETNGGARFTTHKEVECMQRGKRDDSGAGSDGQRPAVRSPTRGSAAILSLSYHSLYRILSHLALSYLLIISSHLISAYILRCALPRR